MSMFIELSFLGRSLLGCWTLLLCLLEIVSVILSLTVRQYRNALLSLPLFSISYVLWQVSVCCLYMSMEELTTAIGLWIASLPYMVWLLIMSLITLGSATILYSTIHYSKTFITPLTIERCADELACGICYWKDNGHVLFANDCMNSLSTQMTGKPLMDGNRMRNAITDSIMTVGERVWQFSICDIAYGKEMLHELIASDVSELFAESRALQDNNDRLQQMNEDLRLYGLKIDETVHRQEMLQAKINIHDEMNRLMLSTMAADLENEEELNQIFSLWERDALLLCMESNENQSEDAFRQLNDLAQALSIEVLWENDLLNKLSIQQRTLFFIAAQEAITNAVKHGQARKLHISFTETQKDICCLFGNACDNPKKNTQFTGGLANLSVLAEEQNVIVSAKAGETYILSLIFPKNK